MSKSLLLISDRPEDITFAKEVARCADLDFRSARNSVVGAEAIAKDNGLVVFVDASSERLYQSFEMAIQDSVGLFSDKISSCIIHFISHEDIEKVPYIIQSPLFGNYIVRSYGNLTETAAQYARLIKAQLDKRAFGLQALLDPSSKIQSVRLQRSSQKQDAVEAVRNYLIAAKFQTRMATVIANAVDEILMNAIFDAPIDDIGRPLYKLTSRNTDIKLEGKQLIEMHIGYDGKLVAISVVDLFGSLDKANLLSHVTKTYANDEYKVRGTVANAGIGLATVYRTGGSLFFVTESRVRTEVTVFFRRTDNFRDFKDQFRFISTQFYF